MKPLRNLFVIAGALTLFTSQPAQAWDQFSKCEVSLRNAAAFHHAEANAMPVRWSRIVRLEMGAWTEAMANNHGSATATVAHGYNQRNVKHYRIFAKQIGSTDRCKALNVEEMDASELPAEALQSMKYKTAVGDVLYMSEADYPWEVFYSQKPVSAEMTEKEMRRALNAGNEYLDVWSSDDAFIFVSELAEYTDDRTEKWHYEKLKKALLKDFDNLYVYRVGEPDSGEIKIYLFGRNADGHLVGLRTLSVET